MSIIDRFIFSFSLILYGYVSMLATNQLFSLSMHFYSTSYCVV